MRSFGTQLKWSAFLRWALPGLLWGGWLLTPAWPADLPGPITLLYYERAPFNHTTPDGKVVGLTASRAEAAFKLAGLPFQWKQMPANRLLETLKAGEGRYAASGWYKNAERQTYARFTDPIYIDKPLVGIACPHLAIPKGCRARDLLARPGLRLLMKEHFSNGPYLDQLIHRMAPQQIQTAAGEVPSLVAMIQADRADLFICCQEEVEVYLRQAGPAAPDFKVVYFSDLPMENGRYILLGKGVPEAEVLKLNRAIHKLFPSLHEQTVRGPEVQGR